MHAFPNDFGDVTAQRQVPLIITCVTIEEVQADWLNKLSAAEKDQLSLTCILTNASKKYSRKVKVKAHIKTRKLHNTFRLCTYED